MAITALMDPAQLPNRSMDQQTFDNAMAAMVANLPLRGQQENALAANLNSIAFGGAFAIPYVIQNNGVALGSGGKIIFNNSPGTASAISIDNADATGLLTKSSFDDLFYNGATSSVKGYIRIVKQGDPSKWAAYRVNGWTYGAPIATAGTLTVTCVGYSDLNPFGVGDTLLLQCQRTGDKGDQGLTGMAPVMIVRDEKASGTGPGGFTASQFWVTRTLNTVQANTIPGATLSGNQVTLATPGTYEFIASAPAAGMSGHQVRIRNVSDNTGALGTTEAPGSSAYFSTRSFVRAVFVIGAPKVFVLEHYSSSASSPLLGLAAAMGNTEVYAEMLIRKIA